MAKRSERAKAREIAAFRAEVPEMTEEGLAVLMALVIPTREALAIAGKQV